MAVKWVLQLLYIMNFPCFLHAIIISHDYASANLSTSWINNDFIPEGNSTFIDGSIVRSVLLKSSNITSFPAIGCGFYGNRSSNSFFFAVYAVEEATGAFFTFITGNPAQILWMANRANPVGENATLQLTSYGDLVLRDADGTFVWSSNTSNVSVARMDILGNGNLVLVNSSGFIRWQSWDHPTDTWLPYQQLVPGQRLLTSVSSPSNWSPGPFYLSFIDDGLFAFIESNPPQTYSEVMAKGVVLKQFKNGSLTKALIVDGPTAGVLVYLSRSENFNYMRLDSDGHLRVYQWVQGLVDVVDDILTDNSLGNCTYPTFCGSYGVCSDRQYCSCPVGIDGDASYFRQLNSSPGCIEATQLSCQSSQLHHLLELDEVSYFGFVTVLANTDIENCKQACLKNCSCKAALFRYNFNFSSGNCSLPSQIFSLIRSPRGVAPYNSSSFIKVQKQSVVALSPNPLVEPSRKRSRFALILGLLLAALVLAFLIIWICFRIIRKRKYLGEEGRENTVDEEWENYLNRGSNLPMRFTYDDLKSATENFHKKLGGGGFGSVFEGTLRDSTKLAVKRLDRMGQGRKEFLAEVMTIGSIHHVSLVRLLGFCAENSHRLLVYEYMSNGSLEKWIFHRNPETAPLEWEIRKKIILNIAKGLAYLHEDCQMRIAHLDVKPQNILLDDNFNAKLSDFGLARLIDRNQSQVITQMRGTRGYMAPEWLSRKITEKVDVYSYGVVMLEIVCGRKNLDLSQAEEDDYLLLPIVKKKAEEDRILDLIDICSEDMQRNGEEAVKMVRSAIWCLHNDPIRRPSMSMVVKVLEGVMVMEPISDYSFLTPIVVEAPAEAVVVASTPQPAMILSGPR